MAIWKGVTTLAAMSEKKALKHTTAKLHPDIFSEIEKRIEKKEFPSFNAALNKLLMKALGIKKTN